MKSSCLLWIMAFWAVTAHCAFSDEEDDGIVELMDPNNHLASDHQLIIRSADGGILVGTDSGDHFTAESRSKTNEVKGVYSWIDPRGEHHTVTYTSGKNGYRTLPLEKAQLDLPPFPRSLYADDRAQARKSDVPKPYIIPDSEKDIVEYDEFIVISPDEDDEVTASPSDNETTSNGSSVEVVQTPEQTASQQILVPGDLLGGLQIAIGTPVAASRPSATAVAGANGTAQVSPSAQAFVGPGGVAIAFPTAQSAVGPNGISISRPIASSSAGNGGVAIAGGISTAFAGIDSAPQKVLYNNGAAFNSPNLIILPIVANYYFQAGPTQQPITANSPAIFQQNQHHPFHPPYPYTNKQMIYSPKPKGPKNPFGFYSNYGYEKPEKVEYSARTLEQLIASAQ